MSNTNPRKNVFHRLPLELKFGVFDHLFSKEGHDLVLRGDTPHGNLQMLEKLSAWDGAVFQNATSYLNDGISRIVLYGEGTYLFKISGIPDADREEQPLLDCGVYQGLRRLPESFRNAITRVHLPNLTMGRAKDRDRPARSEYVHAKIGMYHMQALRSIREIDVELDAAECTIRDNRSGTCSIADVGTVFDMLQLLRDCEYTRK